MFILSGAGDQDVIEIHKSQREYYTNTFYESLEGSGGIFDSKRHPEKLPQAERSDYCCFGCHLLPLESDCNHTLGQF